MLEGRFIAYTLSKIIDRTIRQVPVLVVKQRGLGINSARSNTASLVPALPDAPRQVYKDVPSLPPVFSQMYAYFRVHLEDDLLTLEGTLRIRKISPTTRAVL